MADYETPNKFEMAIITADMTELLQNIDRYSLSVAGCKLASRLHDVTYCKFL
jgi:hypothetical protein